MDLLTISPGSHPSTLRLMNVASLIALHAAIYWKRYLRRVRPSEVLPALLPPISVPGHASFPSGHATQARLIARCVKSILPFTDAQGTVQDVLAAVQPGLDALAFRIARNREIAGLHYPSDSEGGRILADNIFDNILAKDPMDPTEQSVDKVIGVVTTYKLKSKYQVIKEAAMAEWLR